MSLIWPKRLFWRNIDHVKDNIFNWMVLFVKPWQTAHSSTLPDLSHRGLKREHVRGKHGHMVTIGWAYSTLPRIMTKRWTFLSTRLVVTRSSTGERGVFNLRYRRSFRIIQFRHNCIILIDLPCWCECDWVRRIARQDRLSAINELTISSVHKTPWSQPKALYTPHD